MEARRTQSLPVHCEKQQWRLVVAPSRNTRSQARPIWTRGPTSIMQVDTSKSLPSESQGLMSVTDLASPLGSEETRTSDERTLLLSMHVDDAQSIFCIFFELLQTLPIEAKQSVSVRSKVLTLAKLCNHPRVAGPPGKHQVLGRLIRDRGYRLRVDEAHRRGCKSVGHCIKADKVEEE